MTKPTSDDKPEPSLDDRMDVRFDPMTLRVWPAHVQRRLARNAIGKVVHYVANPGARTPSGGRYVSQRFTVVIDGRRWVGQVKKGTDIVRLSPEGAHQ